MLSRSLTTISILLFFVLLLLQPSSSLEAKWTPNDENEASLPLSQSYRNKLATLRTALNNISDVNTRNQLMQKFAVELELEGGVQQLESLLKKSAEDENHVRKSSGGSGVISLLAKVSKRPSSYS